jgi:hypothetical protein
VPPIDLQHIPAGQLGAFETHQAAQVGAAGLVGQPKVPALPAIWWLARRVRGVGHECGNLGGNKRDVIIPELTLDVSYELLARADFAGGRNLHIGPQVMVDLTDSSSNRNREAVFYVHNLNS